VRVPVVAAEASAGGGQGPLGCAVGTELFTLVLSLREERLARELAAAGGAMDAPAGQPEIPQESNEPVAGAPQAGLLHFGCDRAPGDLRLRRLDGVALARNPGTAQPAGAAERPRIARKGAASRLHFRQPRSPCAGGGSDAAAAVAGRRAGPGFAGRVLRLDSKIWVSGGGDSCVHFVTI
jgi:hypothetical protein